MISLLPPNPSHLPSLCFPLHGQASAPLPSVACLQPFLVSSGTPPHLDGKMMPPIPIMGNHVYQQTLSP